MKKKSLVLSALALSLAMAMGSTTANAAESAASAASSGQLPSLAPMLEKVMPSVVSIYVEGHTTDQGRENNVGKENIPPQLQPFFGENSPFCQEGSPFQSSPMCQGEGDDDDGQPQPKQENFQALGAGVVINAEKGYVVTNSHVVDNADKIQIRLSDGRKYDGKVLGKDPRSDIALVQLKDFKNLTAIQVADSDQLRVGDYTVAIGNPYGLGETATSGIVSALGRSGLNIENYENFIQTDAAINRGNSGGALVNLNGELIGLNTAILAPGGGNIGIGFAIPSNMVKSVVAQIVEFGEVKRGELGITGTELNSELAQAMKVDAQRGAFVSQVRPKSAADVAGIKAGDVIVTLNGKAVSSFSALRAQVGSLPVGSKVALGLLREGKPLTVEVTLQQSNQAQVASGNLYSGIEGAELSNTQVDGEKGVKVDNVKPGSAAAKIGLKKDDIILGVNQQAVQNIGELRKILDSKPAVLALNVRRGDSSIYLLAQ
ncbi:serine endoprotease DegP [Pectobacterium punjabense]|uniref:Serine endoprotease DegP n=1 Tax=Pectobacterium punjabense TaxID=2108399 RepID=A0ABX6L4V3_9GAMM|nr:serine endoprotease DegP [Pectobacterium punjabense]GKW13774.1 serine endoprotease DegQ [Pectobacterium carotovorum subsp. carotovorum]MBN3134268.1 serine endoprotease DegP [Pectobacterium punjabense]MBS4433183.1 serine endoprotease DegP [Pectobacterium punjabense]MBT9185899.1 serine endoprotease DegP [Pectobacterium punjabense]MCE5380050.1 serine endoprotease DegP [Pectobacterium punjabense]